MKGMTREVVERDLALAAQLAAVFVRPLDVFDDHSGRLEPLTASEIRTIAAHPAFRAPINRALSRATGLTDAVIGREFAERLRTDCSLRCAVLLVSQSIALVNRAAVIVGAAVLHKRVLAVTRKGELERIKILLDPEGYEIATREAPLLHGPLAALQPPDLKIFDPAISTDEARRLLTDFGLQVLCRFVDHIEPQLSELMSRRCRSDLDRQTRGVAVGALNQMHCDHILRLVRRRLPQWSVIIG